MKENQNGVLKLGCNGLGILLSIIFMVLKLCNVIAWKWVFVFLPVIISGGITIIAIGIALICAIIVGGKD